MRRFKAAARTTKAFVVLLAVLVSGLLGVGVFALAAPGVPAPTISSGPANPTNSQSATFTLTDKDKVTSFQCALDPPYAYSFCGSSRPTTKTYSGLGPGPHQFRVKAVTTSGTSDPTSYSWTIDTNPPSVSSINRTGPTPTNAPSVSWAVTFTESVTGVDSTDFQLVSTGVFLPLITSTSGSGASYTVTATTGFGGAGTLTLKLVDNDSIRDLAGNKLGGTGLGNGNFTGQPYAIDKIAPPTPVLTQHPTDPSPTAVSTFAWTDSEAGVTFQCALENGSWNPCTSPYTFTVNSTNNGEHQFEVRAVDAAGNVSDDVDFEWKLSQNGFTISGNPVGLLYPGVWRPINITFTNHNNFAIKITSLTVNVSSSPPSCPQSPNIELHQSTLSSSNSFSVPANGSATMTTSARPEIRLTDLPVNQDPCKGGTFNLAYSGTATK